MVVMIMAATYVVARTLTPDRREFVTDVPERRSAGVSVITATPPTLRTPARTAPTRASFELLYRETVDDLFAYVVTVVRDRGAAEEVVASSFERAYRRVGSYVPRRGSQREWLFGIARNAALD